MKKPERMSSLVFISLHRSASLGLLGSLPPLLLDYSPIILLHIELPGTFPLKNGFSD